MTLHFDEFVFDRDKRQLFRGDEEIHLPPRTFRLLEILLEQRPKAISKSELIERIWPDVVVEESNLKTTISELRAALGDTARPPRFIRTVFRFGYAFCSEVVAGDGSRQRRLYQLCSSSDRYDLSEGVNTIGRDPSCSVWVDSLEVSRQHARITIGNQHVVLEDLGSKNGTWVGGQRISTPVELRDGDRFDLGELQVIFRAHRNVEESTRSVRGRRA